LSIRRPPPACPPYKDHAAPIDTLSFSAPAEEQPAKTFVFAGVISKTKNRRKAHGGKRTLSSSTATPARQRLDTVAQMRKTWLSSVEIDGAERNNMDGSTESASQDLCSDDAACLGQREGELAEKDDERQDSARASQSCEKCVDKEKEEDDLMQWVQGLELSDAEDG